MFDKLKGLGQLAGLMGNLPKIQEEIQSRLSQVTVEGTAGAGMVTVKVSGKFDLISCAISDDAMAMNDKEMLEDLIKAAVNDGMAKAREQVREQTEKAMGIQLPPGFKLPGFE